MLRITSRPALAMSTLGLIALGGAAQAVEPLPYLLPTATGATSKALLTVGDTKNLKPDGVTPYRMVGIPDGLGAYDNNDGTFTVLMNHELGATAGATRAHLSVGAFVSKWIVNKSTLQVQSGADLIQSVQLWNSASAAYVAGTTAFNRFCSADLPPVTAFYNATTSMGTQNRIFMNGEESGSSGRAFAHVVTGTGAGVSYELPRLGKFAWENAVACPTAQAKTIVMGLDDSDRVGGASPSEVNIYVGTKTATGTDIEKAGLTNGLLYGLKVTGKTVEDIATTAPYGLGVAKGATVAFTLAQYTTTNLLTDNGTALQAEAVTNGITQFSRPEDGAWDPTLPNDFWFVTTDQFDQVKAGTGAQVGRSRLWRMRFTNIANPEAGGSIAMMLDGTEAGQMYDNMTIDGLGRIILQEDVGNQAHNGKTWAYSTATGTLAQVFKHDPARFGDLVGGVTTAPTAPFSADEEASGIIDVSSILGTGMYLAVIQAHYTLADTELVQGGQFLALYIPASLATTVIAPGAGATVAGATTGPSTAQSPYILPTATGALTKSVISVGESVNTKPNGVTPYRMVGIPDGLGAYDNSDGTFTLLMNHELGNTVGDVRAHQSKGAFVSKWVINKTTLVVQSGADLIQSVRLWDSASAAYVTGTTAFNRFCSADLPPVTAFYNATTSMGTQNRIFMNGEETDSSGRAFAHVVTGTGAGVSYELPRLGKFAWENAVACPTAQAKTIVMGMDDSDRVGGAIPSEVNIYVGTKTATGTDIEKAGLTNGLLYGLKVTGKTVEDIATTAPYGLGVAKGATVAFTLAQYTTTNLLTDNGTALQAEAVTNGITQFSRVEDGAWDPTKPNDFWFVTTDRFDQVKAGTGAQVGRSRLWRVRFTNIATPEAGGSIAMMLDGTEAGQMYDNMTIDGLGRILLQEDVGNQAHNGKTWVYSTATGTLAQVFKHDPARFGDLVGGVATAPTAPFNADEEASGIIDASAILGAGWFLGVTQAHYSIPDTELVQGGQVFAMFVPTTIGAAPAPGPSPSPSPSPTSSNNDDDNSCGLGSATGLVLFGSLMLMLRTGRRRR